MNVTELILCEDIRHEVGDKFSLMGVLESSIKLHSDTLRLSVFLRAERRDDERLTAIRIRVARDQQLLKEGKVAMPGLATEKLIRFAGTIERLKIAGPCTLEVSVAFLSEDETEVAVASKPLEIVSVNHRPEELAQSSGK